MNLVSIIIPCLNEAENILPLFSQLRKNELARYTYEYIFVDDGSTDNTWKILQNLKSTKTRIIQKIKFSANYGHQAALHAGLTHASGDIHITMDADLQHPPSVLPKLLQAYESGSELVIAQRINANLGLFKKITSHSFYFLYNLISPIKTIPNAADFRLSSKKITGQMLAYSEQNNTFRYIIGHMGIKPLVLPYTQPKRANGNSEYTFQKMLALGKDALLQNSSLPLYAIFIFGIFVTLVSSIGFILIAYFRYFVDTSLFTTVPLFGFFILANNGIMILIMGIIGIYVANMQKQTLNRPKYHVELIRK